jgi:HSP20 family protein
MHTIIPFNAVNEIRRMDEVLERLFGGQTTSQPTTNTIPIDVVEVEGKFIIRGAVIGIQPEDLSVTVENNILTIKGESPSPVVEGAKVYRHENVDGSYSRSLRLPSNLNLEAVTATFKNGYVTITIPRIVEETLRIPVTTEA